MRLILTIAFETTFSNNTLGLTKTVLVSPATVPIQVRQTRVCSSPTVNASIFQNTSTLASTLYCGLASR